MPKKIDVSKRNKQIAQLIANGWTNKEIARELGFTEKSVCQYSYEALIRCGARNRTELALIYNGIKPTRPSWLKTQSGRIENDPRTVHKSPVDPPSGEP